MKERIPSFTRNPDKKQITIKGRSLRWRDLPSFYAQGCVRKLVDLLHAPRATSREDESSLLDFIRSAILLEQFVKRQDSQETVNLRGMDRGFYPCV